MRTVDLFCGCGGMSLGFQAAEYELVAAFENWDFAANCYRNNFHHPVFETDLSKVTEAINAIRPLHPEVIIGGPPCQDFSNAGNREEGERANLTLSFAQIVCAVSPRYFVMENVGRAAESKAYAEARKLFIEHGYGLTERVLNASYFGVPQRRKRFFCIGILGAKDNALDSLLTGDQSILPMTVRQYYQQHHLPLPFEHYYRHPRSYSRRAIFSVDEPAPTIRGVNRPRPAQYQRHATDSADPEDVRAMTLRERATIQTFPATFILPDASAKAEQIVGNAVPVKLAEHVARCLMQYARGQANEHDIRFTDWLINKKKYTLRAASDVLSRIKRANAIVGIENNNLQETLRLLDISPIFAQINASVRSQIRRAIRLYHEYTTREENTEHDI